jgi:dihydroorotase
MKILIKQATIIDDRHPDNGKARDILIEDGIIKKITGSIKSKVDQTIEAKGLCVSIGWMDLRANFRDPGDEQKEDLSSGLRAAIRGGFTAVGIMPSTNPAVDCKSDVEYIIAKSQTSPIEAVPIGAVSKEAKGESLAEIYDMSLAGARGFTDDKKSLREAGLLNRALLYTHSLGLTLMHFPYDDKLIPGGQINEGIVSTAMGLRGIPEVSEIMMVERDLNLVNYNEAPLHLGPLSSIKAVDTIYHARQAGAPVTCEVALANLVYNEEVLEDYETVYKVLPPLRTEDNRLKLIDALRDGKIDVVSSDHSPEDEENKKLEFEYAAFGMAGIELFFPMLWTALDGKIDLQTLVATFSFNPRRILGMEIPKIKVGEKANLTLFSIQEKTKVDRKKLETKAYNVPEMGKSLKGKVLCTIFSK